jgi:hypothetical protein
MGFVATLTKLKTIEELEKSLNGKIFLPLVVAANPYLQSKVRIA